MLSYCYDDYHDYVSDNMTLPSLMGSQGLVKTPLGPQGLRALLTIRARPGSRDDLAKLALQQVLLVVLHVQLPLEALDRILTYVHVLLGHFEGTRLGDFVVLWGFAIPSSPTLLAKSQDDLQKVSARQTLVSSGGY